MQTQLIKSTFFFQQLLSSRFRTLKERVVKTIMLLSLCHLFGLITPIKCQCVIYTESEPILAHERGKSLSVAAPICAYRMLCCTTGNPECRVAKCFNTIPKVYHAKCG